MYQDHWCRQTCTEVEDLLNNNKIFRDRMAGIGAMTKDQALATGGVAAGMAPELAGELADGALEREGFVARDGSAGVELVRAEDFLHVDGSGVLQITENDIPPPPVNRPPTANAGPDHTITLPVDTVALQPSPVFISYQ